MKVHVMLVYVCMINMNVTCVPYVHVGDVLQDVNDDSIPQSLVNRFAEEK